MPRAYWARLLRHVASRLGELPGLAQQAARGEIEWSKLREVVRVASPETEAVWLDLCMHSSYAQIKRLVSMAGYGQLPGEAGPGRRTSEFSELTFHLSAEARVIYDRGLQAMSQEAGKMLDMAEARLDLAAELVRDEALLAKCPARDNSEWLATVAAREESVLATEICSWWCARNRTGRIPWLVCPRLCGGGTGMAAARPAAPTICI